MNSADDKLMLLFLYFPENRIYISCKLSVLGIVFYEMSNFITLWVYSADDKLMIFFLILSENMI